MGGMMRPGRADSQVQGPKRLLGLAGQMWMRATGVPHKRGRGRAITPIFSREVVRIFTQ
ncbi:hypothetical protein GGTG_00846 [Gaeumannomyces tritici R3-111a-1]|uniref:Uncharacterized protein n=1 Tax=Gaeumannomyces tritici (strain R3-111a-1) TaxID=644352 RepID=J3NHW0_GAET3|nr:hypothetical protein GGTG_00846 [Gaeumannomyces tritici R3-111a-1]EJT80853.1 hypothetical protein GGTG_00846 [Gaeumannomyces tritici R3-111a-1]